LRGLCYDFVRRLCECATKLMNDLLLIGLNHKVASIEVRERLAFTPDRIRETLPQLIQQLACDDAEAVILSTCNRTEVYVCADDLNQDT
jgi:glutamyl-tRNA reductase